MVDAVGDLIEAGRVKVYGVDSFDSGSWYRARRAARGARAAARPLRGLDRQPGRAVHPRRLGRQREIMVTGVSFGAYHAANFALRRADLFPLAICQSGVYDVSVVGGGERGDAVYFNNPVDYVSTSRRRPPRLAARPGQPAPDRRPGPVGGHDGRARQHEAVLAAARREGDPPRARRLGLRRPARLALVARADRPSSPPLRLRLDLSTRTHLIGLLLGTEEDWPTRLRAPARPSRADRARRRDARADERADHQRAVRPALPSRATRS